MFDLARKVVVLTGAAGNLGSAAAKRFREAGARTVLVDRSRGRLREAFPDLERSADHLLVEGVDMTDPAAVEALAGRAIERFGGIDGLFHTVGGFEAGPPVHEADLASWERMFALNLRTALLASRAVVPHMLARRAGRIVHVAARPAFAAPAGFAPYAASKSAVLRLCESLAAELKDSGVNVNCVVPGIIDTPDNRRAMPDADRAGWVEPEAIADVAVFLVSNAARRVTGAAIPVYGRG